MEQGETLFIREHREEDVREVALLAAKRTDIDGRFVAEQIAGWQRARTKLPSWAATDGIIFPPQLAMEQCSSEQTARYKAALARRWLSQQTPPAEIELVALERVMIDLTGGFGIDHAALAPLFTRTFFIEKQTNLCDIARHNFALLGLTQTEVRCGDCTELLPTLPPAALIYADPARRDAQGNRTYAITDCTPDIIALLPLLIRRAGIIMLKLSPMLDWHQTVTALNHAAGAEVVREVHIVAAANECKELLVVVGGGSSHLMIYCVNDDEVFTYCPDEGRGNAVPIVEGGERLEGWWLFEPNAALMKAGCFGEVCRRYGLKAIAANSHLFVSDSPVADFPGRQFRISGMSSMNKKELRENFSGITRANITTRNFPMSVADLRRRLHLADGGDTYIFATTRSDGTKVLLKTEK